jgi:predicted phage gp36 major capsid-like protein
VGLINWIFDIYQHTQIDKLRDETARARAEASVRTPAGGVDPEKLERAVAELALAVKTMQRVLVAKNVCTASEFGETLSRIDLEDGRMDGRSPIQ